MEIPEHYKTQHLFLLVGENPLPNYVAAQLLLNNQGTIYMVFSKDTKDFADCLKKALKHLQIKEVPLGVREADGCAIARILQEEVGKIKPEETIGLHYTGGTKIMAAHAYRALLHLKPVFSYLDSRGLQLCIDDLQCQKTCKFPVALEVNPSLQTILGLHNLKWKPGKEPQDKPRAKEAAIAFAEFHVNPDFAQEWRSWCDKTLGQLKKNGSWKKDRELEQQCCLKVTWEDQNGTPEVKMLSQTTIDVLQNHLGFDPVSAELNLQFIQARYCFQNLREVCRWLDGVWLEEYVLLQIQGVATSFDLSWLVMSLHIEDPKDPNRGDQFEFDVAFLRGYQLFGISCTTSDRHALCKQKLFEASLRARQLGGDEARIALASCYNSDTTKLKQEVNLAISDRKVEVFGRDDLAPAKFSKKLTN